MWQPRFKADKSVLTVVLLVSPTVSFISPPLSLFLSPQVSFFLFIVFVVYTMLPFSMRDAIIASILTSASHTLVLSVWLSLTVDQMELVVWQVKCLRNAHLFHRFSRCTWCFSALPWLQLLSVHSIQCFLQFAFKLDNCDYSTFHILHINTPDL